MIHKATDLISKTFDDYDVKYRIVEAGDASVVEAGFVIDAGPAVVVRFISKDDDNDVAVRVFDLINHIPLSKKYAMMEACNTLSAKVRFYKFFLNRDNGINVEADLPEQTSDECVGECCFELFARIMSILTNEYHILAETLYGSKSQPSHKPLEILQALKELRDTPIIVGDEDTH